LEAWAVAREAWAGALGEAAGGPAGAHLKAVLGLAEAHHMRGEALQQAARRAGSADEERALREQGASECRGALERYEEAAALGADADLQVDAANALATWAEIVTGEEQLQLLTRAEETYAAYLRGAGPSPPLPDAEPDVDVLMNLGDVLLRRAECLHENGAAPPDIDSAYSRAVQFYSTACASADSRLGDDLSGLVYNWGVCLLSAGQRASAGQRGVGDLLTEAMQKFETAKQLSVGNADPVLGLGDTLMCQADLWAATGDYQQAWACAEQALTRGFQATLGIDRYNVDATIGVAEASAALGKFAAALGAEPAKSREYFQQSVQAYQTVLEEPKVRRSVGGYREVADVQYNCACAAARAGNITLAQQLLAPLLASGFADRGGALQDADLEALHPWLKH